ncbi:MAG: lysophospholipid acyltransferase family protein [Planctomycetaceae bacterium]
MCYWDIINGLIREVVVKIRNRRLIRLLAWVLASGFRLLFATCRLRVHAVDPATNAYLPPVGPRFLFCIWHDHIVMTLFSARPRKMAGLVSRHQDGSFVADTMEVLGILPVRGSTNRGGAQAVRQLLETAREHHIAITPDGPLGPRRRLKGGIVYLASRSGRKVVPAVYSCARGWRLRAKWTDMLVPKPFTRIHLVMGEPLAIPADAERDELEEHRARLQAEMERLEAIADRLARGEEVPEAPPRHVPMKRAA